MALKLTSGETLILTVKADLASTVSFVFAGPSHHTVSGTGDGQGSFTISQSTNGWAAGEYIWQAFATLSGVVSGTPQQAFTLLPALSSYSDGTDLRSTAKKAVEMLSASLSSSSSAEVELYKINNRELRRYSVKERLELLAYWKRQLSKETRKASGLNSLGPRLQVVI